MRRPCLSLLTVLALVVPVSAAPEAKKGHPADDSAAIADKLLERIDVSDGFAKAPLKDVLKYLQDRADLTILLDARALAAGPDGQDPAILADQPVTLPAMKRVRLETVLRLVADQINADFLIAPDHVKLTSPAVKDTVTGSARPLPTLYPQEGAEDMEPTLERKDVVRVTPYLTVAYKETPAADALKDLAARAGRTVVVSAAAADKAKAPVTVCLSNVAFDTAAAAVAEAAGLRAFRTRNVVVVVTPERAKQVEGTDGAMRVALGPQTVTVDELEAIARLFTGKAGTPEARLDAIRRELEKQRQDREQAEDEKKELTDKVKKLEEELGKLKKKQ